MYQITSNIDVFIMEQNHHFTQYLEYNDKWENKAELQAEKFLTSKMT